ncbi:hypothetical protein EV421DRAFT_1896245 [Armillaria borealis]|uniref:Uncharacterized protein n=1 Tax=Armillaria borealis TaxID=47425 RepID=A0AA39K4C7_9AGAR|nr:hypothetical protein EV421DRAFT_1896245 [Armillaria borealis]
MLPVPAGYPIERLSGPMVHESSNFCLEYIQFTNKAIQIVASLLHWGLFETLSVQLYLYYLAFPKDRKFTKYLGVYVVEFAQTILVSRGIFAVFGYGFGDLEAVTKMRFNWLTVPVMSAAAACVGQVFYAYRILILSKSRMVPIFVTCVLLTSSVAAIITGVFSFQAGNITKLNNRKTSVAVGIWCGGSALCDVVIAIYVDTILYLMRSNTGFRRTRIIVTKLIRLTIETGSVTGISFALSAVVTKLTPPMSSCRRSAQPHPLLCVA